MTRAQTSQLYAVVITALVLGFVVMRRIRPQPVRPNRLLVGGALIILVVAFTLVGVGGSIIGDPLALALVPVFVVAGGLLGVLLVRTMTFWSDPATGELWMRGGAVFALILVGTIVLRIGMRAVLTGNPFGSGSFNGPQQHSFLYDLSADLLFLTVGLWVVRAFLVYRRHRQHIAAA
jgi:hypothetical protein